jgi:hypothetical protein
MTPLRGQDLERPGCDDQLPDRRERGHPDCRVPARRDTRPPRQDPPARRPAAPVPSSDTGARRTLTAAGYRSTVRRCRRAITDLDYQENS